MIVREVRRGRGTVLIEWLDNGRLRRGWLPDHLLNEDKEVSSKMLKELAPYGVPFEKIFKSFRISPEDMADALRRRNIWTEHDLMKNPGDVARAILTASEASVSKLQTSVREFSA